MNACRDCGEPVPKWSRRCDLCRAGSSYPRNGWNVTYLKECYGCARLIPIPRNYCYLCATTREKLVKQFQVPALNAVNVAVRRGDLPPAREFECVDCGKPATQYDHRDYAKPLDVAPVCRSCNTKRGPALQLRRFSFTHHA